MRSNKNGFTLTEVVIATFLAAASIMMVMGSFTTGARTSQVALNHSNAMHQARGHLERLTSLSYNDAQLTVGGPYIINSSSTYTVSLNSVYDNTKDIAVTTSLGVGEDAMSVTFTVSMCRGLH